MASPSLKPMRFNIFSISVFSINVNTGDTSYVYLRRKQGTNIFGIQFKGHKKGGNLSIYTKLRPLYISHATINDPLAL